MGYARAVNEISPNFTIDIWRMPLFSLLNLITTVVKLIVDQ